MHTPPKGNAGNKGEAPLKSGFRCVFGFWLLTFKDEIMLVLSRDVGKVIEIENVGEIHVVAIKGGTVRLGLEMSREFRIHRKEVAERILLQAAREKARGEGN